MSGGGVVYNDFLAMADNKKISKNESDKRNGHQAKATETQKNVNLGPSINDKARLNHIKERPYDTKNRVHSENSFVKEIGAGFMNKTVEVGIT